MSIADLRDTFALDSPPADWASHALDQHTADNDAICIVQSEDTLEVRVGH